MDSIEELKPLIELVTFSLTGKRVEFCFRQPVFSSCVGLVYKSPLGQIYVDIEPNRSLEEIFQVVLHEIGHIFWGHVDEPEEINYQDLPSGLVDDDSTPENMEEYHASEPELQAENFRREIGSIAEYQASYLFGSDSVENKLLYLSTITIDKPEVTTL